ncbi:divisome protein SepX/GlpR [Mycolicibacter minnesotensis]
MPSIPQSLLWISLVVLWLFVLVPMLVSKRDAVRRTSDVALATRVLTSGSSARLLKRGGPAAGHRSDPDWQQSAHDLDDDLDDIDEADEAEVEPAEGGSRVFVAAAAVFVATTETQVGEQAELDYLDVDVVAEDSDELPLSDAGLAAEVEAAEARARAQAEAEAAAAEAEARAEAEAEAARAAEAEAELEAELEAEAETEAELEAEDEAEEADADAEVDAEAEGYEYEYVEDSSGLEPEAESPRISAATLSARARRPRKDTAAAVSARKYEFRKRVLMVLAAVLVFSALLAFTVAPTAWWLCGVTAGATVLYLAYLRRQTRIEQQVRMRRARRAERPRAQRENVHTDTFEVVPSRLRRPGVAVLEIDDEDPVFEHLEYAANENRYGWRSTLARAAGQ